MVKTLVALYKDTAVAQQVVEALLEAGFSGDDLSLLVKDRRANNRAALDQAGGAGSGAGFGALVGALVGIGAALVPGIGPLIDDGGALAVAFTAGIGAAAGALTGGITGRVLDLSLSEEEAERPAEGLPWGGAVVSVTTKDQWLEWAQKIMARHEALSIDERVAKWYESDWSAFSSSHKILTQLPGEMVRERSAELGSGTLLGRQARVYKYNN